MKATRKGVETVPLEGIVRMVLKICKVALMTSVHFLKLDSAVGDGLVDIVLVYYKRQNCNLYVYRNRHM